MTTTAHEDQFTVGTQTIEPVRQPYDTVALLKRNIADLGLALKQQTGRAEAAEAELEAVREDNHSMMLEVNELRTELALKLQPAPQALAVPNEIGLGEGECVIWPVKIGGVHGLAFVKTNAPQAVGAFHAEPEDGQIELGAGDSVIHFGNAESAMVLAERLQYVIALLQSAEVRHD